jgi:hypothetical protein
MWKLFSNSWTFKWIHMNIFIDWHGHFFIYAWKSIPIYADFFYDIHFISYKLILCNVILPPYRKRCRTPPTVTFKFKFAEKPLIQLERFSQGFQSGFQIEFFLSHSSARGSPAEGAPSPSRSSGAEEGKKTSRRPPAGAGSPHRSPTSPRSTQTHRSSTAQELADARIGARPRRTGRLDLTRVGDQPRSSLLLCFSGSHRSAF